jgi:deoxyhypusine monooxygenase
MWEASPPFEDLQKALDDPTNPIGMRMRAAYYLRQAHWDHEHLQESAVQALAKGLNDERHGSLMRHEFAYLMGQLRDERCCDALERVLLHPTDCVMVRHEAAEALGAIGVARSEAVLRQVLELNRNLPELSETCQIALNVMEWRTKGEDPENMPAACACMISPYSSIDPAPPHSAHIKFSSEQLGNILCDAEREIFERYRAMFSLRNRGSVSDVEQLCRALTTDTSSALLRHEVAYVLGQLQHPASVEALEISLERLDEHMMVRHESAEALGAINGRWVDVERILNAYTNDKNDVVRESCMVALDAADYWGHCGNAGQGEPEGDTDRHSFAHQKSESRIFVNHFNVAK